MDNDIRIQVRLEDDSIANFKSFVVNNNGKVKDYQDLESAERDIQKIDQYNLEQFMISKNYNYKGIFATANLFINWYANLGPFDKVEFINLLQKVHKINE